MRVLDIKCLNPACGFVYEEWVERNEPLPPCPNCSSKGEIIFTQGVAVAVEKDAYERYLHKRATDEPIRSVVPKNFKGKKKAAGS